MTTYLDNSTGNNFLSVEIFLHMKLEQQLLVDFERHMFLCGRVYHYHRF